MISEPILKQSAGDVCSRDIVYRKRFVRPIQIVYTDIFLDVSNYNRDVRLLVDEILGLAYRREADDFNSTHDPEEIDTVTGNGFHIVIVCATPLYAYISGVARSCGRNPLHGCIMRTDNADIFVCDMSMEGAPDRVDRLVTFNVDPFEACTEGKKIDVTNDRYARFVNTFKHFMSGHDETTDVKVHLVFNIFLLNDRAVETFCVTNNVAITLSDVKFVFANDNTKKDTVLHIVCNYCTDLMLCLNNDMKSFVVDGVMPSTVDFALSSNALNLVILKTRPDLLKTSPESEYFRFKQFYYTFAYGKQNKWGIDTDGGNDSGNDRWRYIYMLNDALQLELVRLYKTLCRFARQDGENLSTAVSTTYVDAAENEDAEKMIAAREQLFKAYLACPILLGGVDIRSITLTGNDEGKSMLKRDQKRLLTSLKTAGDVTKKTIGRKNDVKTLNNVYDTMTYPPGGDVSDSTVLELLFAPEILLSSCQLVVSARVAADSAITYNRFLSDLMF